MSFLGGLGNLFKTYKPPKPMNVANVTQQANTQNTNNAFQTTAFNRPNQTNAYGNTLSYAQTGTDERGNPIFSQNTEFGAPAQQFAGGFQNVAPQYFSGVQNYLSNRPDMSGTAAFNQANQLWHSVNDADNQRQIDAADNRFKNQGLAEDSDAYKNSMQQIKDQIARNQQNFQLGAQNQMFGQGQQDWQNQINQFGQLTNPALQYGFGSLNSTFQGVPGVNVGNVDVAGLNTQAQNQAMQAYQAQLQNQGQQWGAIGGMVGAALNPFSPFMGGLANFKPNGAPNGIDATGSR